MSKPTDFDFMGETKLMGYGESDSSGAWIKLQVTTEDLAIFRGLKGEVFDTAMRNVDKGPLPEPKPEKGPYGEHAKDVILSGFFNSGKLRELLGGDEGYQEWCRNQPCAVTGEINLVDQSTGLMRNEYAHVRRAGEAGTAYKPKYSGIPLAHRVHQDQHHLGESACLHNYGIDVEDAQAWFDKQVQKHLKVWIVDNLKQIFETDTLTKIKPSRFYTWAVNTNLVHELPKKLTTKYAKEYGI